jgi:hypothetical protein
LFYATSTAEDDEAATARTGEGHRRSDATYRTRGFHP